MTASAFDAQCPGMRWAIDARYPELPKAMQTRCPILTNAIAGRTAARTAPRPGLFPSVDTPALYGVRSSAISWAGTLRCRVLPR
eukprot:529286-Rhodomonas_salina.1